MLQFWVIAPLQLIDQGLSFPQKNWTFALLLYDASGWNQLSGSRQLLYNFLKKNTLPVVQMQ
jgi:hypothetical protein